MSSKLFTVGPTQLYPGVEKFLIKSLKKGLATLPHRGPDFSCITQDVLKELREFYNIPENYSIFFTYSATEGMEILSRSLENSFCHIVNGAFGDLWVDVNKAMKKDVQVIKEDNFGSRVEFENFFSDKKTLIVTANDTSSGVSYSSEDLVKLRKEFKTKFICVDTTSSFGAINYDITCADAWICSVQKNLGLPPGLGLLIVNDKIIRHAKKRESKEDVGGHHRLSNFVSFQENNFTPSTPNILLISALGFVVNKMKNDFGTLKELEEFELEKAEMIYSKLEKVGIDIVAEKGKSLTTIVIEPKDKQDSLKLKLSKKGFIVSPGYGVQKDKYLRIANFPAHSLKDVKKLLKCFDNL